MNGFARQLRTPEERVGMLPNVSLPPPDQDGRGAALEELLRRALGERDESAFARVLDACYPGMLRLALAHVRDRAAAEEVIQDSWIAAIEGIDRFEGRSAVRTWLFRILRNIARARGRRDARMRPLSDLVAESPDAGGSDPTERIVAGTAAERGNGYTALWVRGSDPESELLSRELVERIDAALAQLPPRQREVIVLRDVEGWTAAEVCNTLDISDTNQRVMLHRARDRIRNALREYLADDEICGHDRADELRRGRRTAE